jgi:hypothetical protein
VRLWVGGTECQFHVQFLYNFFKCKILILGKFVAQAVHCVQQESNQQMPRRLSD